MLDEDCMEPIELLTAKLVEQGTREAALFDEARSEREFKEDLAVLGLRPDMTLRELCEVYDALFADDDGDDEA
jgi:hypothetical protein